MACGPNEKINQLRNWLLQGPNNAEVSTVLAEDIEFRSLKSFETL